MAAVASTCSDSGNMLKYSKSIANGLRGAG